MSRLKRIYTSLKAAKEAFKQGGSSRITISTVQYNDLLKDRNILITGGGSGIGLAIAKKAIQLGARVVITGRNEDKLKKAVSDLESDNLHYLVWDITDTSILSEKYNDCERLFGGKIDVLVNNAGMQPKEFFPNVSEDEWEKIYQTNSKGTYFLSQEICKRWIGEEKSGRYKKIINISSQGGFVGATYPYRLSKWDICGLTEGLGMTMAKHGILVNGIAPGVTKTEMQSFALKQGDNAFCDQNPLRRVELPEEVAEMAAFMMSDACNFLVGQTILIDGGYSLK